MASTQTLTASCHCHNVHFTLDVPTDQLPLKVHLCHCDICRQTHGAPCSFHAPLPATVTPTFVAPSSLANLTGYTHAAAVSTRLFCSTCGCHIGDHGHDNIWYISVSVLDAASSQHWVIDSHAHTHSTRDGGLSRLLGQIDDRKIPIWNPDQDQHQRPPSLSRSETLLAQCHCAGVSFTISRPRPSFLAKPENKAWLHPSDETKWLALIDVCNSCRLVTGTHVIGWLFVPRDHTVPTVPGDLRLGSCKTYVSSEGVLRGFCGTCGATVFYSCADRPTVVDVATGILRADEGAMLEDWAVWRTARVGFAEDGEGFDGGFLRALREGLEAWGRDRHGVVRDFVVGAECRDLKGDKEEEV